MPRTTIKIECKDPRITNQKINNILSLRGYKLINKKGENVWENGMGLLAAEKYIKVEFNENTLILSGWIKTTMPEREEDLNGMVGVIPKKQILKVIKEIQDAVV